MIYYNPNPITFYVRVNYIMKEPYFTFETIGNTAQSMLETLHNRQKRPVNIDDAALLVLDMQNYFLDSASHAFVPSAPAVVPNIKRLQEMFVSDGRKVIQTRHTNTRENGGQMNTWWKQLIEPDSQASLIVREIFCPGAGAVEKNQYDAFYKTNLEERLNAKSIKRVFITGVMTHLCCESTARSAFARGFDVYIVADATATYNRQFHMASLLNLSHGFAVPVLTKDVCNAV